MNRKAPASKVTAPQTKTTVNTRSKAKAGPPGPPSKPAPKVSQPVMNKQESYVLAFFSQYSCSHSFAFFHIRATNLYTKTLRP